VALDENLGLVAVGRNVEGQLGNGSTTSDTSLVKVGTPANVSDFSVGQTSAAAIAGGKLWAWGWNGSAAVTTPTRVGTGTGYQGRGWRHPLAGSRPGRRNLLVG